MPRSPGVDSAPETLASDALLTSHASRTAQRGPFRIRTVQRNRFHAAPSSAVTSAQQRQAGSLPRSSAKRGHFHAAAPSGVTSTSAPPSGVTSASESGDGDAKVAPHRPRSDCGPLPQPSRGQEHTRNARIRCESGPARAVEACTGRTSKRTRRTPQASSALSSSSGEACIGCGPAMSRNTVVMGCAARNVRNQSAV